MMNELNHPNNWDLYDFFSSSPVRKLSAEERETIAANVFTCPRCTRLGEAIEGQDAFLEKLASTTEKPEERAERERAFARFQATICREPRQLQG